MSKFGLLLDAETIQHRQKYALTTLEIIRSSLDEEITSIKLSGGLASVGFLQDLSNAIYIITMMLFDQNEQLKEAVDVEYKKRKEENNHD